mmetsp:Transcript_22506/g.52350  ORF Transcript_22506/g.52350 Transcript_22506/m.52350 type:complete len:236 (-) Transcript_22506:2581-3288(-)
MESPTSRLLQTSCYQPCCQQHLLPKLVAGVSLMGLTLHLDDCQPYADSSLVSTLRRKQSGWMLDSCCSCSRLKHRPQLGPLELRQLHWKPDAKGSTASYTSDALPHQLHPRILATVCLGRFCPRRGQLLHHQQLSWEERCCLAACWLIGCSHRFAAAALSGRLTPCYRSCCPSLNRWLSWHWRQPLQSCRQPCPGCCPHLHHDCLRMHCQHCHQGLLQPALLGRQYPSPHMRRRN